MKGLKEFSSNILAQTKQMVGSTPKAEDSSTKNSMPAETKRAVYRVTKLTIPAKVPSWTKNMSLETYTKQITTWKGKKGDVPEHFKYHDLMEKLKKNTEIKGIQRYVAEHLIPVLINVED